MKKHDLLSKLKSFLHPKRMLCLTLAGLLCVGSIQTLKVNASSISNTPDEDNYDDYDYYIESYSDYSGGEDAYEYSLSCDQSVLSFGRVSRGSDRSYLPFRLSNTGSTPIDLVWYMTGNEQGAFQVEQPASLHLESGQSYEFYVSVDASLAAGTYNAAFRASDDLDPGGNYGVVLPMSVTIEERTPYVTSVTILPDTATMSKGSTMSFSANVKGENNPNLNVTWSVYNNQSSGTYVDGNGKLVVDSKEGSDTLMVVASSVLDPDINDYAYVSLTTGNHTVSLQADSSAGGTVWGGGAVSHRSSCEIFASPNNGYQFTGWKYKNQVISTSLRYTIPSVTEDMSVTATFKQINCYVTTKKNHDKAGSVTASQNVNYGGAITLQANANSGYKFDCWKEGNNVISKDAKYTVSNITGNREFTAYFTQTQYKVSVSVTPQDTGYTAGGATYNAGDNVTLTATSYKGYHFEKWTSGDKVLGTDKTLVLKNLQADINIVANFAKDNAKNYTITASCSNAGGTISPSGASTVSEGSNVIYSIVPKTGYMVSNVTVDKTSVGAVYSYSFTSVNANHTITVSFQPVPASTASSASSQTGSASKPTASAGNTASAVLEASPASEAQASESALPLDDEGNYNSHHDHDDLIDPVSLEEYNAQTGVFQMLNITPSEAREAIASGDDLRLLKLAFDEDYIMVNIHNEYAASDNLTTGSHYANCGDNFPNMEEVVYGLLNEDDKMCAFEGNQVSFNFTMYSTNDYPTAADKQIQKVCAKQNLSAGELFEILMVKTTHGDTQVIKEFSTPLQVIMKIPDSIKESGRAYCIVRSHAEDDGSLSISFLQDLDDDPDTITFETDRLSSYAIAYQGGKSGIATSTIIKIIIGVLIAVIVITLIFGIVSGMRHNGRHKRLKRLRRK